MTAPAPAPCRLGELLASPPREDVVVAYDGGEARTWRDFLAHVAGLAARLDQAPRGRWLLGCESSYAFAVGLFALWAVDNVPVLPQNLQPGTVEELDGQFDGAVSEHALPELHVPRIDPLAASARPLPARTVGRSGVALELLTSGSTGQPKGVPKTLAQLENELQVLEATFGNRLAQATILSTVSHQHIYGLLYRILWPLCARRPFSSHRILFWPGLIEAMSRHAPACLVGTPTHFDTIVSLPPGALPAGHCSAVFSSGGPLKTSTSGAVEARLGHRPIEVFGSTETGGLGWRVQTDDPASEIWTPLAGVEITPAGAEGGLEASSPFILTSDGQRRTPLDDRGRVLPDGRFQISGRADRIVKVAEKRLSLDDMERRLAQHPAVARVALTVLDRGDRQAVAAAIVLTPAGATELKASGSLALQAALRRYLSAYFDPVLAPRAFHFADALPTDAQGKVTRIALARLFTIVD